MGDVVVLEVTSIGHVWAPEAKTHLLGLVESTANGKPFIIARAGRPVIKVIAVKASGAESARQLGLMDGKISAREDFDRMGSEEIRALFEGAG